MARYSGPLPVLDEPIAHATGVLGQQHAAEFRLRHGRIVEHSQDRLAISDRESDEILLSVQRDKNRIARVVQARYVQAPSQVGNVLFADGNTGEPHATDATRRAEPTNE